MYLGLTRPNKKEAKQSAAEKAIEIHISTTIPDNTLPSSKVMTFKFVFMQHYTQVPTKLPLHLMYVKYFNRKSVPFSFQKSYFVTKPVDGGF